MDVITIKSISVDDCKITCKISVEGQVASAFRKNQFAFSYRSNTSLEGLPESIAVIPVLAQLLPISWVFDAAIETPTCDKDFLESIPEIKRGYQEMYPRRSFGGKLEVGSAVKNEKPLEGSLCLFSGGLDAHDTALRHSGEKPSLLLVRGADISQKNDIGWNRIVERVSTTAETIGSSRFLVESNFRHMLDYKFLDTQMQKDSDTWWHGMQYGIGLLSLAAPIAWQNALSTVYIASSFTAGAKGTYTCASDPTIDNRMRFFGVKIVHDGYENSRLDKLRNVAAWCKENDKHVYLRVCAKRPVTGDNCCACEKCWRTMFGLYAIGEDPSDYGFDKVEFSRAIADAHRNACRLLRNFPTRYGPIIQTMRERYTPETVRPDLRWLYDLDVDPNSELYQWINERLFRMRNYEKKLSKQVKELRAENRRLVQHCEDLEREYSDFKNSFWYRMYAKTTKTDK